MTPAAAAELLATAAGFDQRKPDPTGVAATSWAAALDGVNLEDAKRAIVMHYSTSREFIYPGDITAIIKTVRAERVRAAGDFSDRIPAHIESMPDGDEHTAALLAWQQETARRIGDGEHIDDIAPRLQLVPADGDRIRAITEKLARDKRAPGTRTRDDEKAPA